MNPVSENWETVYSGVPCRIGAISGTPAYLQSEITSAKYSLIVMMNYEFAGSPLDIRQEDRILIDGRVYRVDSVIDAEGMHHHFEIRVENVEVVNGA
jgi:hypothetical protein